MRVHVHNMTQVSSTEPQDPEKPMTAPSSPYRESAVDITNDHPDPRMVVRVTHMDDGKPGEVKDLGPGEVGHFHVFVGRKLIVEEIEL